MENLFLKTAFAREVSICVCLCMHVCVCVFVHGYLCVYECVYMSVCLCVCCEPLKQSMTNSMTWHDIYRPHTIT